MYNSIYFLAFVLHEEQVKKTFQGSHSIEEMWWMKGGLYYGSPSYVFRDLMKLLWKE